MTAHVPLDDQPFYDHGFASRGRVGLPAEHAFPGAGRVPATVAISWRHYLFVGIWGLLGLATAAALAVHSYRTEPLVDAPSRWPAATTIPAKQADWTGVLFLHPQCPCSRATLAEFSEISGRVRGAVRWVAVLTCPSSRYNTWSESATARLARGLPRLEVMIDRDGVETDRFHATISGELQLYDRSGRLRFQGGITPSRGHEGTNVGAAAVVDLISQGHSPLVSSRAYGCRLSAKGTVR